MYGSNKLNKMGININKTKVMSINGTNTEREELAITITMFRKLGKVITKGGSINWEITRKRQRATNLYYIMNWTILRKMIY